MPPAMRMTIYDGFMAPSIEPLQVTCPTAQCSWPIIPTLAVCGGCINNTESIRSEQQENSPNCTATSSSRQQLRGPCTLTHSYATDTLFDSGNGTGNFSVSSDVMLGDDSINLIANFGGIKAGKKGSYYQGSLVESQSAECALWYCIEAHSISVSRGKLRDEVIGTWQTPVEETQRLQFNFSVIPEDFNLHVKETYTSDALFEEINWIYFNRTVEGVIAGTFETPIGQGGSRSAGGDFIWAFFHYFDDLDSWISRLARSMTNQIRSGGKGKGLEEYDEAAAARIKEGYRGRAFAEEVIIRVRWGWIIYPVALSVLSIVFLVAQILSTSRRPDVRAWKDEPLATLWLDVDANMKEEMRQGLNNPDGLRTTVGDREVQISRDDNTGFPAGFPFKTQ